MYTYEVLDNSQDRHKTGFHFNANFGRIFVYRHGPKYYILYTLGTNTRAVRNGPCPFNITYKQHNKNSYSAERYIHRGKNGQARNNERNKKIHRLKSYFPHTYHYNI